MATKVQRIMTQPINLIFRFLQTKSRVQVWLFEHRTTTTKNDRGRHRRPIVGYIDEYMNLVLDDAEEVSARGGKKERKKVGRILLKGDNVTMMVKANDS